MKGAGLRLRLFSMDLRTIFYFAGSALAATLAARALFLRLSLILWKIDHSGLAMNIDE